MCECGWGRGLRGPACRATASAVTCATAPCTAAIGQWWACGRGCPGSASPHAHPRANRAAVCRGGRGRPWPASTVTVAWRRRAGSRSCAGLDSSQSSRMEWQVKHRWAFLRRTCLEMPLCVARPAHQSSCHRNRTQAALAGDWALILLMTIPPALALRCACSPRRSVSSTCRPQAAACTPCIDVIKR